MVEIIGRGEKTAKKILQFIYPKCHVHIQVPIWHLQRTFCPDYELKLSEENRKRTLDLFVIGKDVKIVFRVQDQGTHSGDLKSKIDSVQKGHLEDFGLQVVDLLEQECKELFKDRLNPQSVYEIVRTIKDDL